MSFDNQRLFDLVRQQRMELHEVELITDEEYIELAKEHSAVARLEDYDELRAQLAAQTKRAESIYRCFHCGFETADDAEAAAHFGDRDEEFALCQMWASLTADDKVKEFQSTIRELEGERQDNALLRVKIEGLEFQVEGQRSEIHSFKPFRECNTIHQVFNVYDSMEGRALAAEEERDQWKQRAEELRELLQAGVKVLEPFKGYEGCYVTGVMRALPSVTQWGDLTDLLKQFCAALATPSEPAKETKP